MLDQISLLQPCNLVADKFNLPTLGKGGGPDVEY